MVPTLQGKEWQVLASVGGASLILGAWQLHRKRLPPGRPLVSKRPLVVGHRGCRKDDGPPENSLEAFEYALNRGADGFELDTRLTKDGVAVVFHDAFIGRCIECEVDLKVSDLTLDELQALSYRGAPEIHVATLEDALLLAKKRGKTVLVETKDIHRPVKLAEDVAALVQKYDLFDNVVVIGFDPRSLYTIRRREARIRTCLLWRYHLLSLWKKSETEVVPRSMGWCVGIIDFLLVYLARTAWLPTFLGVSAIGPMASEGTERECAAYQRRGFSTYLWVVNDVDLLGRMEALSNFGLWSYSTDDALFPG